MPTATRGQEIFNVITGYIKEINLTCKSFVRICADVAPCMTSCFKGFPSSLPHKAHTLPY